MGKIPKAVSAQLVAIPANDALWSSWRGDEADADASRHLVIPRPGLQFPAFSRLVLLTLDVKLPAAGCDASIAATLI